MFLSDCEVKALGMEDGRIPDSRIKAAYFQSPPKNARFNGPGWVTSIHVWLLIDLAKEYLLMSVETQGDIRYASLKTATEELDFKQYSYDLQDSIVSRNMIVIGSCDQRLLLT